MINVVVQYQAGMREGTLMNQSTSDSAVCV